VNAPLNLAHSPFGGSVAARVLRCPASVGLVAKVPESLRKTSAYADRGTALHAAMALLLGDNPPALESLAGRTFGDYTVTHDDVENALRPAFAYVDAILDTPGAEYYLERRIAFPTLTNVFGTVDLLIRIGRTIHVIDFKFGSGVRVLALTPDGDTDIINSQLLFYGAASRHSLDEFCAGANNFVLTILQPQSIDPDAEMVSAVSVSHAELDEFVAAYRAACEQALSPTPHLERGAWCRFCPAQPICPAHTGPLLDLAQLVAPKPLLFGGAFTSPPEKAAYLQVLADGLNLVNAVKDIGKTLHDQAKAAVENGDSVPGYALTAGRAERRWRDDDNTTCTALWQLGLQRDDVMAETMRSVKQVELRAKARGLKIPPDLIISTRSGTSLVRAENARFPVLGREETARLFAEALKPYVKDHET
jgi:hypothetical protein